MPLASTNVKLDAEKLQLAKLKGCNVSLLCREALDSFLNLYGDDVDTMQRQLIDIEKQIQTLCLEKKILLSQLESMEASENRDLFREAKYNQWKLNLAYQVLHKTIDWNTQKELFRFSNTEESQKWILTKLKAESLI